MVKFLSSAWYEATGKKRPHSPGGDDSEHNDNSTREAVSKGTGTPASALCLVRHLTYYAEKWRKKAQQELEEEEESDGEGTTKRSQSDVHPVPDCLLISNSLTGIRTNVDRAQRPSLVFSSRLVTDPSLDSPSPFRCQEICESEHNKQGRQELEAAPKTKT